MSVLQGVFPVFQTPFHEDESIDFETLAREIAWLFEHAADGIVMAMVSETLRLSSEERDALAAEACRLAKGKGPVVISVGAESRHTAVRHARHAEACGATAVMAIPPIAVSPSVNALLDYYESILEAVRLPLIIQDAGGYIGKPMPVDVQADMLRRFGPERIYFKPEVVPTGPRLTALREATSGQARVFEGSGGISLVDSYRRGIVGTMPGAETINAQVALWKALTDGNEERIYRLSFPMAALVALQSGLDGFLAVEKYLLVKQGIFENTVVRGPVAYRLDEETRREVDRIFEQLTRAVNTPS